MAGELQHGMVWWTELMTRKPDGARAFYKGLLDLKPFVASMSDMSRTAKKGEPSYTMFIGLMDPVFHDLHLGVQPLPFANLLDTYPMLNGRGYPDTVNPAPLPAPEEKVAANYRSASVTSNPQSSLIQAQAGQKILLRISNLNITTFNSLSAMGLPMKVVGTGAHRVDRGILADRTGDDDEGNVATVLVQKAQRLGGTEAFHRVIAEDDVKVAGGERVEEAVTVFDRRGFGLKAMPAQLANDQLNVVGGVLDEKHTESRRGDCHRLLERRVRHTQRLNRRPEARKLSISHRIPR